MGVILSLFHTVRNRNPKQRTAPVPETHELDTLHAPATSTPTATIPRPRLPPRVLAALTPRSRSPVPISALPATARAPRRHQKRGMADDASYLSFLEKANAPLGDSGAAQASGKGNKGFKTVDEGAKVPGGIQKAIEGVVYVSEADEGFVGVSLGTGGRGLVDGGLSLLFYFVPLIPVLGCCFSSSLGVGQHGWKDAVLIAKQNPSQT